MTIIPGETFRFCFHTGTILTRTIISANKESVKFKRHETDDVREIPAESFERLYKRFGVVE